MKHIPLKYIREDPAVGNADNSDDAKESTGMLKRLVADLRGQLAGLSPRAAKSLCSFKAAWYSLPKSAPVSIVESICRKAVNIMASKCRPVNLPGSDLSLYLSVGSLMSRPERPSSAISIAMAWRLAGPSRSKVCRAPKDLIGVKNLIENLIGG